MNEPFRDSGSQAADADRRSELRTGWSRSDSPHSVAAALKLVNDFLLEDEGGTSIQWINDQGNSPDKFTDSSLLEEVDRIKQWITSRMGQGPQGIRKVNQFLKDNGFTIQLDENVSDTDFGVAAIFAYTDGWAEHHKVGERGNLSVSDDSGQRREVPAIIASGADILQTTLQNLSLNMYRLLTESQENDVSEAGAKDGVYFVQIDKPDEDLYTIASELFSHSRMSTGSAMLHLPTVDLRASGTINALVGATAVIDGRQTENRINQALFEHIMQYNQHGFSARSAAAVEASRSGGHGEKVEFDRPFLLFLVNKGVISSAGYVTLDDMKMPDIVDLKPKTQSSSDSTASTGGEDANSSNPSIWDVLVSQANQVLEKREQPTIADAIAQEDWPALLELLLISNKESEDFLVGLDALNTHGRWEEITQIAKKTTDFDVGAKCVQMLDAADKHKEMAEVIADTSIAELARLTFIFLTSFINGAGLELGEQAIEGKDDAVLTQMLKRSQALRKEYIAEMIALLKS